MCARRSNNKRSSKRAYKTVRYSNETVDIAIDVPLKSTGTTGTGYFTLIKSTDIQGMRKAKNFTLTFANNSPVPIQWALIYAPQGFPDESFSLNIGVDSPASLYEPNQNVIMSGTTWKECPQNKFTTRLARNLNSGDSILLIIRQLILTDTDVTSSFYAQLNYAITL